jgi:hypothetical protein
MKQILLLLFFIPVFSTAQKIAVIDRNFYEPITMMDVLTTEVATKGGVIVYQKDIALVIEGLELLVRKLSYGTKLPENLKEMKFGNTRCIVIAKKSGNKYSHNITLNTSAQNIKTSILLADDEPNKRALQRLNIFIDYLKHNSSAIKNNL